MMHIPQSCSSGVRESHKCVNVCGYAHDTAQRREGVCVAFVDSERTYVVVVTLLMGPV